MPRRLASGFGRSLLFVVVSVLALGGAVSAQEHGWGLESIPADGLRPPLGDVLADSAPDASVPVSVVLADRVTKDRIAFATAGVFDKQERRRIVTDLLKAKAASSQSDLRAALGEWRLQGRVSNVRPLWIGNVIGVDATPDVIRAIARRPDVAWVNYNPKVDISLRTRDGDVLAPRTVPDDGSTPAAIECGVAQMRAPDVWNDFNIDGTGAVIAVIDTGVCHTHPDIAANMWVNPGEDVDGDGEVMDPDDMNGVDDDGNGFIDDLIGWDFDNGDNVPDDTNSHGSHCAGTVAGDGTGGEQSGMAPGAAIMAVRVGVTFSDEVDVWNAMQYAADNGADAVSMSLGWPHNQNPDRATWRQTSENTIDAGTALIIAAGNEGGNTPPDNVRTPGDVPRIISVGATNCSDIIAGFSSRGPVEWENVDPYNDHPYPPGLIKPDVSAPGVNTLSHNICNGYSTKSGTSMATPHVAGAAALMFSANPGLGHDELKQVLMDTAVELGDPGKDNDYGAGRVDAYEAVNAVFGLSIESTTVSDADATFGNGDGGVDTGELLDLSITLRNQRDDLTSQNVRGWVSTETPGVTMANNFATWPDVGPSGVEVNDVPNFSFRVDSGCNYPIQFTLRLKYDDRETLSLFTVRVGTAFTRDLIVDDFETDQGWTVSGNSVDGVFERADPNRIRDEVREDVQPADDVTQNGSYAWVTGNSGNDPGDNDVDAGNSILTSPVVDATDFESLTLSYYRWFYASPTTVPSSDYFRVQASNNGVNWPLLELVDSTENEWIQVSAAIPSTLLTPNLQVRFEVEDSPAAFLDSTVEGLVDDVVLSGQRIECEPFTQPAAAPPNGVGDTLIVDRDLEGDVVMTWGASPVDASHDPPTAYRIYRSSAPDAGFSVEALSLTTSRLMEGEGVGGASAYWTVVAENGGGTSGDDPAP